MTNSKKHSKASDIAILGIFIAIMVVIQLLSKIVYTVWPFPIQPTLVHIPVIIGSIILGWRKGAFLGFAMGMISFLNSTFAPIPTSFLFSPFAPHGNGWSLFVAFIPRIIVGILPFFIYQLAKNRFGAGLSGFFGSATNTVLVLSSAFLFFNNELNMTFKALIASIIATNSIAESIAATVLTAALVPILSKMRK
ncbi:pantothenic acid transporter pant [Lactococcus hodotermopsidis]|uniref:Pantothenic acid transporter pant n=1 Tax=Pseudolactococcus hodotermopsidis TaxID=2709157 RepID=A0A6A0BB83_9LACT|nr:ECF transporter S component [Lactococcus hodotermopsidis]GFH41624.1 pantothenic acid transporter pant [Lactococcus hodotermopsidis]